MHAVRWTENDDDVGLGECQEKERSVGGIALDKRYASLVAFFDGLLTKILQVLSNNLVV